MPDLVTSKIFVDGEKGITASKLNQIMSGAVIQPDFVTAKPSSPTLDPTDQLLEVKGAGTYARITGSQLISSVSAQVDVTPQIYSARLRSFNAIGNPNFEVTQRNCGGTITPPANAGTFIEDRWLVSRSATTGVVTGQKQGPAAVAGAGNVVPGTNFLIANGMLRIAVTTAQTTLAATDYLLVQQTVEGPRLRELWGDVHSISILARSSIANLKFGLILGDNPSTRAIAKLCTLGAANTWALITLPNIPVWPAAGNFAIGSGVAGYVLQISLACGTTYTAPANDAWQAVANILGSVGQSNFLATSGATLDLAYVGHEPGALCTTLMDCPFTQNLDDCLRYYQKSYDYGTGVATVTANGAWSCSAGAASHPINPLPFQKRMAKVPTLNMRSTATGTFNNIRDANAAVDRAVTGTINLGEVGCGGVTIGSSNAGATYYYGQWVADTGW